MMKRLFLIIVVGCFLFAETGIGLGAGSHRFIASQSSDRYHLTSCKVAENILQEDALYYATPEEYLAAGYRPCRKCDPPTSSDNRDK